MSESFGVVPIGHARSPLLEVFGAPRQAGLAPSHVCTLVLDPAVVPREAVRGVVAGSHLWVLWWCDRVPEDRRSRGTVRPPRLGGNVRQGVYATRSPYRANPIGLSLCRVRALTGLDLEVEGADFVDGTPILDLKPYLPWADAVVGATPPEWAAVPPRRHEVGWSALALQQLLGFPDATALRDLVTELLAQDPRPAYRGEDDTREYGIALRGADVHFRAVPGGFEVTRLGRVSATRSTRGTSGRPRARTARRPAR
jgi:tRNA-Thr(GGU) m(6)t(6)A37 methyltransferase TsaA